MVGYIRKPSIRVKWDKQSILGFRRWVGWWTSYSIKINEYNIDNIVECLTFKPRYIKANLKGQSVRILPHPYIDHVKYRIKIPRLFVTGTGPVGDKNLMLRRVFRDGYCINLHACVRRNIPAAWCGQNIFTTCRRYFVMIRIVIGWIYS